jgi:hypothetical protein
VPAPVSLDKVWDRDSEIGGSGGRQIFGDRTPVPCKASQNHASTSAIKRSVKGTSHHLNRSIDYSLPEIGSF